MSEQTQEQAMPSKEEVVAFLKEQIEVKQLQVELQELNARFAKARAEELQAVQFAANMTNPQAGGAQPHTITQEDMDSNPELAEQGFKVGDEVMVAAPSPEQAKSRNLKK